MRRFDPAHSLRARLGAVLLVFAGLLALNVVTYFVLAGAATQRADERILSNTLAERSQRIAKQVLILDRAFDPVTASALQEQLEEFDGTLAALRNGGVGTTPLQRVSVRIAPTEGLLAEQMRDVERLWLPYRDIARTFVTPDGQAPDAAERIIVDNLSVLDAVAKAVSTADQGFRAAQDLREQVVLLLLGLGLVILGLTWWWLGRGLIRPLHELEAGARRIASGDLTLQPLGEKRADEIGGLARAFAEMTAALRRSLEAQREVTVALAAASNEILAAASHLSTGATQEASVVAQIGASVDEVRTTAEQAAQRAQQVADSTARVRDTSLAGQAALESAQQGMADLRARVETIAQHILGLSEQTQSIGEITEVVNDLADQSNLLAVNASIEAAKAGEHGRGFAVVAQEVRNLANQSREATTQIRSILGEIQRAASGAVLVTEEGTRGVEAGNRLLEEASSVIDQLASAVADSADLAAEIAQGAGQQRIGIDQVGTGMGEIVDVSRSTASAARQLEAEAQGLAALAQQLRSLAERFRLELS